MDIAVRTQPSETAHRAPAIERVNATTGKLPGENIAHGDYTSRNAIIEAADKGVAFIGSWGETMENKR